jgi:ribosomal protein S18 acetylase RimI-like enzyme
MYISVRPATLADHGFILSLVPQFSAFALPPWRSRAELDQTNQQALETVLAQKEPAVLMLIAEDECAMPLGFVHLQSRSDYFTGEAYGYIADLAVAPAQQSRGVGGVLLRAAEVWARSHGYRLLALEVFAQNERAKGVYEHHGFAAEVVKYSKEVS